MSRIIEKRPWRDLAHYVELENGDKYYVDSCYIWDGTFETLCREVNANWVPFPGANRIVIPYNSYEEMAADHYNTCENLERIIEEHR